MFKKNLGHMFALAGVALFSLSSVSNADIVHFQHTFDGVANDDTPAIAAFSNNGTAISNVATGTFGGGGSLATGFVTSAPLNLSSFSSFTVEYVLTSSFTNIQNSGLNGTFFGISTQGTVTTGTGAGGTLYNNIGTGTNPAIGLQVGSSRGSSDRTEFVVDSGGTSFTGLGTPTEDGTDGYTILVTYSDTGTAGEIGVNIATIGLTGDLNSNFTNTAFDYDAIAANVVANNSAQGGSGDLESIRVFTVEETETVPEPTSACLLVGVALGMVSRRRRG